MSQKDKASRSYQSIIQQMRVMPISSMGRATCIIILNRSTTYITTYKEPGRLLANQK